MSYTKDEKKIHKAIENFFGELITNPLLKNTLLQYATNEIIKEIDKMIYNLNTKLNEEGLRHDEFELKSICETTRDFLIPLILHCQFQEYRVDEK